MRDKNETYITLVGATLTCFHKRCRIMKITTIIVILKYFN